MMIPQNKLLLWSDDHTIKTLKNILDDNKVAITTTDTVPGLLAPATEQGKLALNHIKQGRQTKPYLIMVSDAQKLNHFIDQTNLTPTVKTIMQKCWPGPLTLIFKAKKTIPTWAASLDGTIAIRCPNHNGLQTLLTHFDALFSTSANRSGVQAPTTLNDVDSALLDCVACVVCDNKTMFEQKHENMPSTIVDISSFSIENDKETGCMKLVREGELSIKTIESHIQQKKVW